MKLKSLLQIGAFALIMPICWASYHYDTSVNNDTNVSYSKAAGPHLSDNAITTRVKAALLADSNISSVYISVDTKDGIVTLTGTVSSRFEKYKARKIARHVYGVKKVIDDLIIKKY